MRWITKAEFKYILISSIFGFVFFLYILPFLLNKGIETQSPYIQFFLFTGGLYFMYFFLFKGMSLGTKQSFANAFVGLLPFLAFDILMPEYHLNLFSGELVKGAVLGMASSDYMLGFAWQGLVDGFLRILAVYWLSVLIILLLVALIKKNFVKEI